MKDWSCRVNSTRSYKVTLLEAVDLLIVTLIEYSSVEKQTNV